MFGRRAAIPAEVTEAVLDRIGLADADVVNLEIWYATFEGEPKVHSLRVSQIGQENKKHLVLARRGDRIRLTTRGGEIVGFKNLSLPV